MVDLLAGEIRPHRLATSKASGLVIWRRGADGGVDDWRRGLGDQPGSDHAGGTSVVGHVGLDGVTPSALEWENALYVSLWSGSPLHAIKSG